MPEVLLIKYNLSILLKNSYFLQKHRGFAHASCRCTFEVWERVFRQFELLFRAKMTQSQNKEYGGGFNNSIDVKRKINIVRP